MHSIALANQKGGVGKTTTAIHLAHGLALAGRRVALFDLDPQGNATVALQGMVANEGQGQLVSHSSAVLLSDGLHLLPQRQSSGQRPDLDELHLMVKELESSFDWLVIDCPPRMDEWGWAGIQLADEVIVPVQAEFFSMHGLSQMLSSLEVATQNHPRRAALRGVLPTMVDYREPVALEILADLRATLLDRVLQTVILRDSRLVEAASFGRTIFQHCPFAKSSFCYADLVLEIDHG